MADSGQVQLNKGKFFLYSAGLVRKSKNCGRNFPYYVPFASFAPFEPRFRSPATARSGKRLRFPDIPTQAALFLGKIKAVDIAGPTHYIVKVYKY